MSSNELNRLRQDLSRNPVLLAEIGTLDDSLEAWLHWSGSHGYRLDEKEVEELRASYGAELSDEDLEQAAGGWDGEDPPPPPGGSGATGSGGG